MSWSIVLTHLRITQVHGNYSLLISLLFYNSETSGPSEDAHQGACHKSFKFYV